MFKLKITTVGNSVGVILPKEALSKMHVKKGDTLILTQTRDGYQLTPFDDEFNQQMEIAENVMQRYRNALRHLSGINQDLPN